MDGCFQNRVWTTKVLENIRMPDGRPKKSNLAIHFMLTPKFSMFGGNSAEDIELSWVCWINRVSHFVHLLTETHKKITKNTITVNAMPAIQPFTVSTVQIGHQLHQRKATLLQITNKAQGFQEFCGDAWSFEMGNL